MERSSLMRIGDSAGIGWNWSHRQVVGMKCTEVNISAKICLRKIAPLWKHPYDECSPLVKLCGKRPHTRMRCHHVREIVTI